MKKIEAVVRPEKVTPILRALEKVGYVGVMVTEIQGHGKQKGLTQQWRGEKYRVEFLPKVKMEIVVKDSEVKAITQTIVEVARTGEIGDGKIFISPIEDIIRIRTDEHGEEAI